MSDEPARIPDEIRSQFPNLSPLKKPPTLFTMNGVGLSMYGKRDFDETTQTYIKTHCICVIFVPLVALGAYRVADAGNGSWYFIGREPLSHLARSWNVAMSGLLLLGALAIGWNVHTSSPEYRAKQEMVRAADLIQNGEPVEAARIYRQQFDSPISGEAQRSFGAAIEAALQSDDSGKVAGALRLLVDLPEEMRRPPAMPADAVRRGMALAEKFSSTHPDGALEVLNQAAALDPENKSAAPLRISLLQQIVAANPGQTNRIIDLALAYESAERMEDCWSLLEPHRQGLGDTEGARLLGRKFLQEGNHGEAYDLLFPYVQTRLTRLHAIESSYTNAIATASQRALDDLNEGRGPKSFYTSYEAATEEQQREMVDLYIQQHMAADPRIRRALAEFKEANRIVHVALDLGIVQLNRAQDLKDLAARQAELEAAEKTFLAIRSFAGESDDYQMFLGQVYYWMGKSAAGKDLFDQLLERSQRAFPVLMSLSSTLRDIGDRTASRTLAEEAYGKAASNEERYSAASLRALTFKDDDDQIAWLEKADPESVWTQIELNGARGKKELAKGNKALAAEYFQKAIGGYQKQPRSAASLNNCGLACFNLYEATGQTADLQRGLAMLEEAIALEPGDSILLQNTLYFLFSRAVMNVLGDAIKVDALGEHASLSMLSHLYLDDRGRQPVYDRLRQDEAMKKALAYLDKAMVLSPKNLALYSTALAIHAGFRDLAELQKLEQRFRAAAPDMEESRKETLEGYQGAKDSEYLEKIQSRIRALEELSRQPAVAGHPLTLEEIHVSLIGLQQQAWVVGGAVDAAKLRQLASETHGKHPSASTRQALQEACFFAASEELARANADYAAMAQRTRRALSPEYLITLVLERGDAIADLARQNENVRSAIAIQKEIAQSYPSWSSVSQWALFRTVDPQLAAETARKIRSNEAVLLIGRLRCELNPIAANLVVENYWTHKLLGDEAGAREVYEAALRDGVPLPPL